MSDLISRKETYNELIESIDWLRERDYELYCVIGDSIRVCLDEQPTAYNIDKVVEELELHSFELGTDTIPVHYVRLNEAIEIVKQGGISDDVCEWKLEDEEANLYLTGCQQRQLIFEGSPEENGYRYCHYCGKKILCKE